MKQSDQLKKLQADALAKAEALQNATSDADIAAFDAAFAEYEAFTPKIAAAIEREEKMAKATAAKPRQIQTETHNTAVSSEMKECLNDDPMGGFKNKQEYIRAVVDAGKIKFSGGRADERLLKLSSAAPSTYGNEASGADGGWAAPPQISKDIWSLSLVDDNLIQYCDNTPIESNAIAFPSDEETPWGTGGPRAYWANEGTAATPTKPKLGDVTMRLEKLLALVPLTNELLADAGALTSYVTKRVGQSIAWKTSEAILNGTGVGQPLGCLTSSAAITVSKDSGQSANTLTDTNLANMAARLPGSDDTNSIIWLYNHDVYGVLYTLKNSSGYPVMTPFLQPDPTMRSYRKIDQILGYRAIKSQHANTLSSAGDVLLLDLSYYRVITKAAGVETASSIHFYFDADATAFRTTFRMMGQPKIKNQISPYNGSTKLSPFLKLQNR